MERRGGKTRIRRIVKKKKRGGGGGEIKNGLSWISCIFGEPNMDKFSYDVGDGVKNGPSIRYEVGVE